MSHVLLGSQGTWWDLVSPDNGAENLISNISKKTLGSQQHLFPGSAWKGRVALIFIQDDMIRIPKTFFPFKITRRKNISIPFLQFTMTCINDEEMSRSMHDIKTDFFFEYRIFDMRNTWLLNISPILFLLDKTFNCCGTKDTKTNSILERKTNCLYDLWPLADIQSSRYSGKACRRVQYLPTQWWYPRGRHKMTSDRLCQESIGRFVQSDVDDVLSKMNYQGLSCVSSQHNDQTMKTRIFRVHKNERCERWVWKKNVSTMRKVGECYHWKTIDSVWKVTPVLLISDPILAMWLNYLILHWVRWLTGKYFIFWLSRGTSLSKLKR